MAIIKATTSQFHLVPKEKHVRSEWRLSCRCRPRLLPSTGTRRLHWPTNHFCPCCCTQSSAAALKLAVHPSRSRRDMLHIILELHRRLEDSTDWLVSPPVMSAGKRRFCCLLDGR